MQPEFWHERWQSGRIGFHQRRVDANLAELWPALGPAAGARVLVPLCGKSLDLLWLRGRGHTVVGVELSPIALEAFCLENGVDARRRPMGDFDLYGADRLELYRGDVFALNRSMTGNLAAVYDRGALVSFAPGRRDAYVAHLAMLTPPGTTTLLVALEYPPDEATGPPFAIDAGEVRRLYGAHHDIVELRRRDVLDSEPRMRARGVTALAEVCYRITRR